MSSTDETGLLELLPVGALALDAHGRIRAGNGKVRQIVGRSLEELAGKSFFEELRHLDGVAEAESRFLDAAARGAGSFFFLTETDDGSTVKVQLAVSRGRDGSAGLALLDPQPTSVDLQRRVEDVERRLDRVNALRHELNNLLMGLMGHAELLQESPDAGAATRSRADRMLREVRRIRDLLVEMRDASRGRG